MMNNLNVTGKTRSRDQCEEDNLTVTRNRSSIDFYLVFVVLDFFVSPVIRNFFQNDLEPDPLFLIVHTFLSFLQPWQQSDVMVTRYDVIGNKRSSHF